MAQQFLLPCECGLSHRVAASQAGRIVMCSCGREQRIPALGALRHLAIAPTPALHASQGTKKPRSWTLACIGASASLLFLAVAAWWLWHARVPTPDLPEIQIRADDPDVSEAVQAAVVAVEHSPRSGEAWGHLAMVLHGNAMEKSADNCYAAASALDPHNPDWPYLRGYMHQDGAGGPEIAIPLYQAAARLSPATSVARVRLGDMLVAQGQLDEAEEAYKKVLSASPQDPDAQLGRATIAVARQQYAEAQAVLESIAEHPQVRRRACELLAIVYQRRGDPTAAAEQRRRLATLPADTARRDDPMNRVGELQVGLAARLRRANMLRQQQQFDEALNLLKDAVARYPNADEAWANLGAALHKLRDAEGAERALRRCIELAPQSAEYHMNLGMLLLSQQRFNEAAGSFRRTIQIRPTHGLAYFGLGECFAGMHDQAAAREAFAEAHRLRPDDPLVKKRWRELTEAFIEPIP